MKNQHWGSRFLCGILALFLSSIGAAGSPLWTFTPTTPTTVTMPKNNSVQVIYSIKNETQRQHVLEMTPIPGITQQVSFGTCAKVFTLNPGQSCNLELLINGDAVLGNINGGPVVCEAGNRLQCNQPNLANRLKIVLTNPTIKYTVISSTGANGILTPSAIQVVESGATLSFTATPNANYLVERWLVDGGIAQIGGTAYTLNNITANHTVTVTFTQAGTLYSGSEDGNVHYSVDNGMSWTATTQPSPGNAVNSVYADSSTLYAASHDHRVYYSTNNGTTWQGTSPVPNATAVLSVFATATALYAGTEGGAVYVSIDTGTTWVATASAPSPGNAVRGLFVMANGTTLYAGSADGFVYYSSDAGASWTAGITPDGSPIHAIFATNTTLYANTANQYVYTNPNLTAIGGWTPYAQSVYTLFVNANGSIINAATQAGFVFSLISGDNLGVVGMSPINSLFFLSNN